MNTIRTSLTTLAVCAAVALPLLAAEKFGAKAGLWETTTTMKLGGAAAPAIAAIPPEMLANLPAAQRAQVEQALGMAGGKPVVARSCVTEKDLAEGAFRQPPQQQELKCTFNVASSTAKRQETTFKCESPVGPADGKLVVDLIDPGHVKGTMQVNAPQMSMDTTLDAKWLGADCGTTK